MDYICLEKTSRSSNAQTHRVDLRIVSSFSFDIPLNPSERTIIISHLEDEAKALYAFQDKTHPLRTEAWEQGFIIHWPGMLPPQIQSLFTLHTCKMKFYEKPIWDQVAPVLGKQLLSIPAYGLHQGVWYDSWLTHFSKTGKVLSLVPTGTQSRLQVPIESSPTTGLSWEEGKKALPPFEELEQHGIIDYLQSCVDVKALGPIKVQSFDRFEASCLLLLKQAFPDKTFVIINGMDKKLWPARFKNFLESINATWESKEGGSSLDTCFEAVPKQVISELDPLLNKPTRILDGLP